MVHPLIGRPCRRVLCLLLGATALGVARDAGGQPAGYSTFDVRHTVRWVPVAPPDALVARHAWHDIALARPGPETDVAQGWALLSAPGSVSHHALSVGVRSQAIAHSTVDVDAVEPGLVQARLAADGIASAQGPLESVAYAYAGSRLDLLGDYRLGAGGLSWLPILSSTVIGTPGVYVHGWRGDPIDFSILDPATGLTTTGTLLSIAMDVSRGFGGAAELDWDAVARRLRSSATEFAFTIDMTSPFTSRNCAVDLRARFGVITRSADSCFGPGVLPPVGASSLFDVTDDSLGEIDFGYDLGPLPPGARVTLGFLGDGRAVAAIPEPGTVVLTLTGLALIAAAGRRRRAPT